MCTHTTECYLAFKKEILLYATTRVSLEDTMLTEISQTPKTNITWSYFNVESKKYQTHRNRPVVYKRLVGWGKRGDID